MTSDNARGVFLMTLAMAFFTFNDTMIKTAMEHLPMFQAIALRGMMVTLVLVGLGWATGGLRPRLNSSERRVMVWRTACELGATVTSLAALNHMALANHSAIWQLLPLVVTLAAALFWAEPLGWRRISAICVGLFGVMLVIKPGSEAFNIWSLALVAGLLMVCARDLMTRSLRGQVSAIFVALTAGAATMVMGLIGSIFTPWVAVSAQALLFLCGSAVAMTVGLIVVVGASRLGDVGVVSPFRYTSLLWAIVLGYLFFGDIPDALAMIGCVLIVGSGLYSLWREAYLRKSRASGVL